VTQHDPLLAGFYSIGTAARLINATPTALRGWLNGYASSSAGPVIERDFAETRTVSFLDLMELRFISFFRQQGVSMHTLRRAAENARKEWKQRHPLALSSETYCTDRKRIFAISAKEIGDERAWDMASGQHEMWATIEQTIDMGVLFDPKTSLARTWAPHPGDFPDVLIDPRVAFGKPAVKGTGIPTRALYDQWTAEGSVSRVAAWFNLPPEAVQTAVKYELRAA
jgi:uncharacterized protein (DUF433 family)/DNA-binding transcriptional MerR regulator